MTEEELTAIEARAAAATVGPWRHDTDGGAIGAVEAGGMALAQVQQRVPRDNARRDLDAAFIAAARADVPALVAEVRRLRTLVERAFQEGQDGRILDGHDQFVYDVEWKDSDAFKALDDS